LSGSHSVCVIGLNSGAPIINDPDFVMSTKALLAPCRQVTVP
jgi:hypothetical protein